MGSHDNLRLLLTGGTGFIGRRVARQLSAGGVDITAIARDPKGGSAVPGAASCYMGDMSNPGSFARYFDGQHVVIHAASVFNPFSPLSEMEQRTVVVDGLARMLAMAREAKVGRFFALIDVCALGPTRHFPLDETRDHPGRYPVPYTHLAHEAFELVKKARAEGYRAQALLVGPTLGRDDPGWFSEVLRAFFEGSLRVFYGPDCILTPIHADDLACGIVEILQKAPAGEDYILTGEAISVENLFQLLADLRETRAPHLLDGWHARLYGAFGRLAGWPFTDQEWIDFFLAGSWAFSSGKAKRELRFGHRSLRETLREYAVAGPAGEA